MTEISHSPTTNVFPRARGLNLDVPGSPVFGRVGVACIVTVWTYVYVTLAPSVTVTVWTMLVVTVAVFVIVP